MPRLVRLPAHINDDEVRVYWDKTDDGDDLHVWAPRGIRGFAMSIFTAKRLDIASEALHERYAARAEGIVKDTPSYLEELEAAGYDPRTLIFSIRKKGAPEPVVEVPDDIRRRLEDAQTAILALSSALNAAPEAKGVYIMSQDEGDAVRDAATKAEAAIASALDMLNGEATLAPHP